MLDGKDPTPEEMSQWFDEVLGSKPKSINLRCGAAVKDFTHIGCDDYSVFQWKNAERLV